MKYIAASFFIVLISLATFTGSVYANDPQDQICSQLPANLQAECVDANEGSAVDLIDTALTVLTFFVGAVSVIVLIIAGLMYVASGGSPDRTKRAKTMILYAVVGIVLAITAQLIVQFVLSSV